MASGTINLTSTKSTLKGKIEWSSSSNGSNANTSNVHAVLYIARTDTYTTTGTWGFGFQVGSQTIYSSWYGAVSSNWIEIATIDTTVAHQNSGYGTCYISGYVNGPSGTSMSGYGVNGSQTVELDYIPRYANITNLYISALGLESISVGYSTDSTIDWAQYSINNGTWQTAEGNPFTINNLNPNTTYSIKINVKRADSQLWTESWQINGTTKDISKITSISNIVFGEPFRVIKTNPSGNLNIIKIEVQNELIKTINNTSNDMTINLADDEWNKIYKKLGRKNSIVLKIITETLGNTTYTNFKNQNAILTGKMKTLNYSPDGINIYKAQIWIKKNGKIRRGVVWVNGNTGVRRGV